MEKQKNIFERMQAGELIRHSDTGYADFLEIVSRSIKLCAELNAAPGDLDQIRVMLNKITGKEIDESTILFPPFYTNFGRFITLGKRVFINHACSFLDIGAITIEDDVMIGPRVNLTSENHPIDPTERKTVIPKPILIKKNAWIGAAATILPGVTIGENAIVAAGAVVSKDVPPNAIVAGIPAKVIKSI